ncbi:MAG: hypothetical protein GTN38_04705 [Candidatus Aenigmarchaeota archaeon]|nr:hypothetical protein [Candidatus Aenigmarchaeota archaeon]NIP41048.1 hypothetical protein [Candidatus Aenigmarchaeota archaeon]NIQ17450.1 hypothetical protein [Candidatus Aenigmarchaeota archaeon]NIS73644.1 hypothetical protein [Candidatus Aenigmarchaeota archaeon]
MSLKRNAYEKLYSGFLSKFPEDYAINLGRSFLRFPIEFLGRYETDDERLLTKIGNCELPNPVVLAACYHEPYIIKKAMKLGFGGVTLKVTKHPKGWNSEPTIVRRGEGFVNCVGFENLGMEGYKKFLGSYRKPKPLILNITGDGITEYLDVIRGMEGYADMFELNISCPNTETGLNFSKYPENAKELFRESRNLTEKPIIIKLSPDREFVENNYRRIIPYAIDSGVHSVNFGNTRSFEDERLSMGSGGLSGPDLYENMLVNVERIYDKFGKHLKIIATGGIDRPERAYEAIVGGATCVSYVTGFVTRGPLLAKGINRHLSEKLDEQGMESIDDLVGFWHTP